MYLTWKFRTVFTVHFSNDKKLGDLRPIIKLRPLSKYMVNKHFKMDTLIQVINLVNMNDGAISLDLKDAYLHIPMHPNNRKYLRFHVQGKVYQFKAMCFWSNSSSKNIYKYNCKSSCLSLSTKYQASGYLDDWLIVSSSQEKLLLDREKVLSLLLQLGFIINKTKS